MRPLLAVALASLLAAGLAGCLADDGAPAEGGTTATTGATATAPTPATFTLVTVSGRVVESGPDYRLEGYCGRSADVFARDAQTRDIWVSSQALPWDSSRLLMAVDSVSVQRLHQNGCDGGPGLFAAANTSFALPFWWAQPQPRMSHDGRQWSLEGTPFPKGAEITLPVSATYEVRRSANLTANYTYAGNVTFRNEGGQPHSKVHVVDGGWSMCCPPPEVDPVPEPAPEAVQYHVLRIRTTVTQDPPPDYSRMPQAGACASFGPDVAVDVQNGTLYAVRDRHAIDPQSSTLLVYEVRGGRASCGPDVLWSAGPGIDQYEVRVAPRTFTFSLYDAPWAGGVGVAGHVMWPSPAANSTLELRRTMEGDGVRYTAVVLFELYGPWSMERLVEVPTAQDLPTAPGWAANWTEH